MVGQTSPEFFNYIPVFLLASLQRLSSHLEPGNICSGDSGDLRRRTESPRAKDTDSSTRRGEKGMTGGLVGANNHADTCMHTHTQKGGATPSLPQYRSRTSWRHGSVHKRLNAKLQIRLNNTRKYAPWNTAVGA